MTLNSLFSPLSCQMCLLSSVSLFLFSCLKDIWWFPYLALKLFAVRPMYVSVVFSVVTVAWYTTSSTIHSPFSGQSSFFLQLHFLPSFVCSVVVSAFFRMALLWPSMMKQVCIKCPFTQDLSSSPTSLYIYIYIYIYIYLYILH